MVNTDKSQEAGLVAHILRVFEAKKDTRAQTAASAEEAGKPEKVIGMEIKQRLGTVKYSVDGNYPHITVDEAICEKCPHHFCVMACPAQCYTLTKDKKLVFQYEDCVECGACSIACDQGSVTWHYPKAGNGVIYKYG
jgi:ferredoxin like protein